MSDSINPTSPAGNLIIAPSAFQQYEDISLNIKPDRLRFFIKKAQELDLKPFLGHALYFELIKHFTEDGSIDIAAPSTYQNLCKGCTYTDRNGYQIIFEGLTPTLVYFAFARFIESNAVHYTASGPVVKRHDNADAVRTSDIVKLVQQQRSIANAHANEVEKFLIDNQEDYPLWSYNSQNKSARQAGPRIRGIDRTAFGSPFDDADLINLTNFYNF